MKYNYVCGIKNGKIIEGSINKNSKKEAEFFLTNKGYSILKLEKEKNKFKLKSSKNSIIVFTKMFSSLIKSGISIEEALKIIYTQSESEDLKEILKGVIKEVKSGNSLACSFRKYPEYFDEYYSSIVEAGEKNGFLFETFINLYNYLVNRNKFKKKLIVSLTYPVFLAIFSLIVVLFLSMFVLPAFSKIYDSFDKELPLITAIILIFSNFFKRNWYIMLFLILAIAFSFLNILEDKKNKLKFDSMLLNLKILKKYIYTKNISSFFTILSLSLKSGMDIITSLNMSIKNISNLKIKEDLKVAIKDVIRGESLSSALNNINFPVISIQMIGAGEKSNNLEEMLDEVVEIYQYELEHSLKIIIGFLEPIMIIIIGIFIGTIILAIILPILTLSSAVG